MGVDPGMDHRAFVFDYSRFARELKPVLERALETDDPAEIVRFIVAHRTKLRDPDEGEPLPEDWESRLEVGDIHEYGDLALTRYYDPREDLGMGNGWDLVQDLIHADPSLSVSPILGVPVGTWEHPFDPGRLGSYFQSPEMVQAHLAYLSRRSSSAAVAGLDQATEMLRAAAQRDQGLYVTF